MVYMLQFIEIHRVRLEAGASSATVNSSHIPLAPTFSHQPGNSVFLTHHSSSSLPNTVIMVIETYEYNIETGSFVMETGSLIIETDTSIIETGSYDQTTSISC